MNERRADYDYDMMVNAWAMTLSRSATSSRLYWGSHGVETPGTRNYMGVSTPRRSTRSSTRLVGGERG
jgi:peptide/nickel transport system substrate-binding protein